MKYKETNDHSFLFGENYFIYKHREDQDALHLYLKSHPHSCTCPNCGVESRKLQSTYERILQDTPIHCKQTILHIRAYKYRCLNPNCERKVFMEELPFAKPSQVRTTALTSLILAVSMFLSNEGASKVLDQIGIKVSNDTIQRIYNRIEFIDNPDVEAVGIDDVAIRKGHHYATAIYDLEDHHLIALLEGRDSETLKVWLKGHNKIKLVTRDRATAYASAINEILPECVQVADRFHILQNLLDKLKDIFKNELPTEIFIKDGVILDEAPSKVEKKPSVAKLNQLHYDNTPPVNPDGTELIFDNKKRKLNSKQYIDHAEGRKKNKN
ncbi:ISL3 family transposase [Lutispora sp.]|uniref:ISL3 family transposase n=1 Tax=Lutispora sp. TaxID=2828727 RepID=UPI00356191B1